MRGGWLVVLGLVACSGGGDVDSFTSSQVDATADYSCCMNGEGYECDSEDAVLDCIDGDLSGCSYTGGC